MKYFFLANGWTTGRVWEFGGLWNEQARRRRPHICKKSLCIQDNGKSPRDDSNPGDTLCLYEVEDAILMVEVIPNGETPTTIGQVMLKRLLTAEQVIEKLCEEGTPLASSQWV